MKRKRWILILFIIGGLIIIFDNFEAKKDITLKSNKDNNSLSIMFQDENGKYQAGDSSFNKEGYHFNRNRSKCLMGSKILFDESDYSLNLKTIKSDRCYAYFDNNSFVEDLSGNGNNGTTHNIVSWNKEGITTSDDNKKGYVNMGLANYDFGNTLSYVVRVKFNKNDNLQDNNLQEFMGNWESGGGGFTLRNGKITFKQYALDNYISTNYNGNTNIEINKWYTIIGTCDGTSIKLYINGEEEASTIFTGKIKQSPVFIALGINPYINMDAITSGYTYTTFSDALIFDRALTKEEIKKDYANKINLTNKENLLLWYKFN